MAVIAGYKDDITGKISIVTPTNPLPVVQGVATESFVNSTMRADVHTIASAGSVETPTFSLLGTRSVILKADSANMGDIAIGGNNGMVFATSAKLLPGMAISLNIDPVINGIFAIGQNNGDQLRILSTK